jgi:TonB family protein
MRRPMVRSVVRLTIIATFAVAGFLVAAARADAAIEYCPARAQVRAVGAGISQQGVLIPESTYSVVLSAQSARTVSGTLAMHTADGWYSAAFSNVRLSPYTEEWQDSFTAFSRSAFLSNVLYVRFAEPVVLISSFVHDAQNFVCPEQREDTMLSLDTTRSYSTKTNMGDMRWSNPLPADTAPPPPGTPTLSPTPTGAPGPTDCATPFADGAVARPAIPRFPSPAYGFSGETVVQVAIAASGRLDDAWVWAPSGSKMFDAAAVNAAKLADYLPARSFCEDVPSLYLFRVEFRSP